MLSSNEQFCLFSSSSRNYLCQRCQTPKCVSAEFPGRQHLRQRVTLNLGTKRLNSWCQLLSVDAGEIMRNGPQMLSLCQRRRAEENCQAQNNRSTKKSNLNKKKKKTITSKSIITLPPQKNHFFLCSNIKPVQHFAAGWQSVSHSDTEGNKSWTNHKDLLMCVGWKEAFVLLLLLLSHLCKVCQQGDALNRLPKPHLVCQDPIDSLQPGEKPKKW